MATSYSSTYTTIHIAPAGKSYESVEEAGKSTLDQNCQKFPNTDHSFILPRLFIPKYPEDTTKAARVLTSKEVGRHNGIISNQTGERAEREVFKTFESLISDVQEEPFLVLRSFCLDNKNKKESMKFHVLMADTNLRVNFVDKNLRGEYDLVVLIKNIGIVLIEVKATSKSDNIAKAEDQLAIGEEFLQKLMAGVWEETEGRSPAYIPTAKIIIVPNETLTSPQSKNSTGCHIVYEDVLASFRGKWKEVVDELRQCKTSNPFKEAEFERMVNAMVGIWAMKLKDKDKFHYDELDSSVPHQVRLGDTMLAQSIISSDEKTLIGPRNAKAKAIAKSNPVTDIIRTKDTDGFQTLNCIKLVYLTPIQKNLYDHVMHAIIRGHAGSGKTLLILFKIVDIMKNEENKKDVLLVAPHPHHLRCAKLLRSNGIHPEIVTPSGNKVVIMELKEFLNVDRKTIMEYDLRDHHVFIDDLQTFVPRGNNMVKYWDIGDFIEKTFETSKEHNLYAWFGVDVVQSGVLDDGGDHSLSLFLTKEKQARSYKDSIVTLFHVLRNSEEVTELLKEARDERISSFDNGGKKNIAAHVIPNIICGHKISTQNILYHKLTQGPDDEYENQFLQERIREELKALTTKPYSLPLSQIAIMWDGNYELNTYKSMLDSLLSKEFNAKSQTIEDQINNDNKTDVISDVTNNIMSFETTCVICVRVLKIQKNYNYVLCSRARVRLTFIDIATSEPHFAYTNMDLVTWEVKHDKFIKSNKSK